MFDLSPYPDPEQTQAWDNARVPEMVGDKSLEDTPEAIPGAENSRKFKNVEPEMVDDNGAENSRMCGRH